MTKKEKPCNGNNVKEGHRTKQSYANTRTTGKEQYYTNPDVVDLCIREVQKHIDIKNHVILEPCGGTGEFIEGLRRAGVSDDKIVSFDIEPKHPMVQAGDYLETAFASENLISITNPPFGRASSLAKKFFNHAAGHCEFICYLVPKSWRKWTVHNSLDKSFHLIADIEMPKNCFYLSSGEKKEKDVLNTVFQIWERRDYQRQKIQVPDHKLIKKVLPKKNEQGQKIVSDANYSIITFGHSCGKTAEIQGDVPYKTTTMYLKIDKDEVKEALQQVNLSKYYNNVSYVQALSIQEINYELNEWFGLQNYTF